MIMDTVFNKEHGLTKEEKKAILGFDNVSLKHFKGFNQRSHYNVLYRLYQYRGDEKMANKYKDLILLSPGISGLFVYEDYINDVMAKYPNIKIAMFAKNKDSGIIDLCYSRSGYPGITDSYPIGKNVSGSNEDWTLRHSPTEDFTDGDIAFTFKFRDDWDAVNYVYTDEKGAGRQLGK